MAKVSSPPRVLAIDPTPRGFGYAILEGSTDLVDWGVKSVRCNSIEKEMARLVERCGTALTPQLRAELQGALAR